MKPDGTSQFSTSAELVQHGPHRSRSGQNGSQSLSHAARVLIVDDDVNTATSLASVLNEDGFEAVAESSGTRALERARSQDFDMLVADVLVPPFDGVRVATAFRNINPASYVFLIASSYEVARPLLIRANLAWDFRILLKPIDPGQMLDVLRNAWNDGTR